MAGPMNRSCDRVLNVDRISPLIHANGQRFQLNSLCLYDRVQPDDGRFELKQSGFIDVDPTCTAASGLSNVPSQVRRSMLHQLACPNLDPLATISAGPLQRTGG